MIDNVVDGFLELLVFLPLATARASGSAVAILNENDVRKSEYISLYDKNEESMIGLLSERLRRPVQVAGDEISCRNNLVYFVSTDPGARFARGRLLLVHGMCGP